MRILGHDIPLRDNLAFSLTRYRVWWVILVITALFDFATTLAFVAHRGLEAEANGLVRWLAVQAGIPLGVFVAKTLQVLAVVAFASLHRRLGNLFLLVVIVLNCWAVVMNVIA